MVAFLSELSLKKKCFMIPKKEESQRMTCNPEIFEMPISTTVKEKADRAQNYSAAPSQADTL